MGTSLEPRRVAVLHDPIAADAGPDELDNLVQAREVAESLARLGFAVELIAFEPDCARLARRLRGCAPALVFNLVEAPGGSGASAHLAPAILDALGLSYSGAGVAGLASTGDKRIAKGVLAAAGIATPRFAVDARELADWDEDVVGIVKPACEDGSLGIDAGSVARGSAALARELDHRRARFGGAWFVEEYVEGREINASVLGPPAAPEVLPLAEIEFPGYPPGRARIVDFEAKWDTASFAYRNTPRRFLDRAREPRLVAAIESIARRCHVLLAAGSYSRTDLRVDARGRAWVIEVNANPCIASDAGFMAASREAGLDRDEVVARIVEAAGVACAGAAPAGLRRAVGS